MYSAKQFIKLSMKSAIGADKRTLHNYTISCGRHTGCVQWFPPPSIKKMGVCKNYSNNNSYLCPDGSNIMNYFFSCWGYHPRLPHQIPMLAGISI